MPDIRFCVGGTRPSAVDRSAAALLVHGLTIGHGDRVILRDLDLSLNHGTTLRLRGSNGTGKSTLLRALAGGHPLRQGSVIVCGYDLAQDPLSAKRHLGLTSGTCPFPYLTGREHLAVTRRVYGLPKASGDDLLDRFSRWAAVRSLDTQVRTWSHGMHQQLALLMALWHRPRLLLLDEALDGLDDESLDEALHQLGEVVRAGSALIYVNHRDEVAARYPQGTDFWLASPAHVSAEEDHS